MATLVKRGLKKTRRLLGEDYLTMTGLEYELGVDVLTLRGWIRAGKLKPSFIIGNQRLFRREHLQQQLRCEETMPNQNEHDPIELIQRGLDEKNAIDAARRKA